MKISKSQLKKIIKEELEAVLLEQDLNEFGHEDILRRVGDVARDVARDLGIPMPAELMKMLKDLCAYRGMVGMLSEEATLDAIIRNLSSEDIANQILAKLPEGIPGEAKSVLVMAIEELKREPMRSIIVTAVGQPETREILQKAFDAVCKN
tara:strand:+ start:659 stop:1111 length:453 start_codon:yes stop_codon:yes gene_type:complete